MKTATEVAFRWFSMLSLASFTTLLVWLLWSLLYPYADVMEVEPGSWAVQNPERLVARGTPVLLNVDYCASFERPPVLVPRLEQDGRLIPLKPREFIGPIEGCHSVIVPIALPHALSIESTSGKGSGAARLYLTIQYQANPLRELYFDFVSDVFTIVP